MQIQRFRDDNREVYGAKKAWEGFKKMGRFDVARCPVERLMRSLGVRVLIQGNGIRTTFPSSTDERQEDLVNRDFSATKPNQLWVADFTHDALAHAPWARHVVDGLMHHGDRGSQYLSFRSSDRLTEADIEPSVGSYDDSQHNVMAESIDALSTAEVICRRSSWQRMEQANLETLDPVDWYNNRRLMEPLGYISPAEHEARYH